MDQETSGSDEIFSQINPLILNIPIALILGFILAQILQLHILNSIILAVFLAAVTIGFYFLTGKTITVSPLKLTVRNKLGTKEIKINDIVSMSTVSQYRGSINYQVKTEESIINLPLMKNYEKFESLIEKYANLESAGQSELSAFFIGGPKLKRWKKVGEKYKNTGFLDRYFGWTYPSKQSTIFKFFWIIGFLIIFIILQFKFHFFFK